MSRWDYEIDIASLTDNWWRLVIEDTRFGDLVKEVLGDIIRASQHEIVASHLYRPARPIGVPVKKPHHHHSDEQIPDSDHPEDKSYDK
jgi:hypothetical protein